MAEASSTCSTPKTIAVVKCPKIDDYKNTELHHAASSGDSNEVLECLQNEKTVVDAENFMGWTPLMMACRRGHREVVKLLLENKSDASRKNKYGCNVFLLVVASGDLQLASMLLQHLLSGGISRQRIQATISPLSLAILFQHKGILEYLLTQYFSLDSATLKTGITPLMFAAAMEDTEAFSKLISNGADNSIKNHLNHTAEDIVSIRQKLRQANTKPSSTPVLEQLVKSPKILETNQNNVSLLDGLFGRTPQLVLSPHSPQQYQGVMPQQQLCQDGAVQCVLLSPAPSYFQFTNQRKSSNVSPGYYLPPPPNVTPIPPINVSNQVFFPPEFSPNNVMAFFNNSDVMNARINMSQNLSLLSPQLVEFMSPRV